MDAVLEQNLVSLVPLKVAIEKLRGFVSDHSAEIKSIEDSRILMHVEAHNPAEARRHADRPVPLIVELAFAEEHFRANNVAASTPSQTRTKIQVIMRPKRSRDRRRPPAVNRARQLLASLRSYLMATDDHEQTDDGVFRRSTHMLVPWLLKKE